MRRFLVPALLTLAATLPASDALAQLEKELAAMAAKDPAAPLARAVSVEADRAAGATPGKIDSLELTTQDDGDPMTRAAKLLAAQGLQQGFQDRNGQVVLITQGIAQVHGRPGEATWANARTIAYQTAELQARAAMVAALSEQVLSGRSLTVLENSGAITDPTAQPPAQSREQIQAKAQSLDEAALDAELRKLGVPPEQYQDLPPEKKRLLFSESYESYVRTRAATTMNGVATLSVHEGPWEGNQTIVVNLVWSESLARMTAMFGKYGKLLPKKPETGKRLAEQIPAEVPRLLRCFGVQRCTDETGETTFVVFSQAGLAPVPAQMRATALANAYDKAAMEGKAMLKAFIHERTSSEASRNLAQLAAVTVGEKSGRQEATVQQLDSYQRSIRSGGETVDLAGVSEFKRWHGKVDGVDVAGVVLSWSPRSQAQARTVEKVNQQAGQGGGAERPSGQTGGQGGSGDSTTFDPTK